MLGGIERRRLECWAGSSVGDWSVGGIDEDWDVLYNND